jgi:hypothetical protein
MSTSWPNDSTSRSLRSEEYLVGIRFYKHLAPLERKQIHLLHFTVESTVCCFLLAVCCLLIAVCFLAFLLQYERSCYIRDNKSMEFFLG